MIEEKFLAAQDSPKQILDEQSFVGLARLGECRQQARLFLVRGIARRAPQIGLFDDGRVALTRSQ